MWELFTHPSNIVFSISLSLMLMFAALECVLLILGGGSQNILEQFWPHDAVQADIAVEQNPGILFKVLDWLYIRQLPFFIWLIIFLTCFGLSGFLIQGIFEYFSNQLFNVWIITPACLLLCMPVVRWWAMLATKVIPQEETTALYSDELLGCKAIIILGEAKLNSPAQAKVRDPYGHTHYVLVEPEQNHILQQGQIVVLTQKTKNGFQAIEY
ncbi:YqiJ family protein [Acinetobacter bohemicus]|uniref:YqiJ family protein n=1 Tax=Acinetobacter sp. S4397-1 TaxID=2972915 RepID=UPI00209A94DD|nr:YqiJ family protein [Acinetobacter sp. S4397-1]MCO8044569.1 YqiJ family protein [Acinetobacter sp. S4397-1]